MRRRSAFTLIELIITLAIIAIVGALIGTVIASAQKSAAPVKPVQIPVGDSSNVEASATRIVDVVETDGTKEDLVLKVSNWVRKHPGHTIETITPAEVSGGGDWGVDVYAYLIVAAKSVGSD